MYLVVQEALMCDTTTVCLMRPSTVSILNQFKSFVETSYFNRIVATSRRSGGRGEQNKSCKNFSSREEFTNGGHCS